MMRTDSDLLRATHLSILLQVHLYSQTHFRTIVRVLRLIKDCQALLMLFRMLLDHLAILDLLGVQMTWTLQIVHLTTLPVKTPVLLVFPLAMLKINRTRSILVISKQRQNP